MRLVPLIAVQLFNSILLVYYKRLKEHKTVLYSVFENRNDVRSFKLSQRILALRLGSYSLFQFEGFEVISVRKNSIEYSFVFFRCSGGRYNGNRKKSDFSAAYVVAMLYFSSILVLYVSETPLFLQ